ncbi:unnamed protein product [Oppiella nova]|uniref:Uncharacterized protein n=1 Tax=Oppiella nova TaxID=334625 RepID=A0A7R9MQS9_9ACAR|nr:unnamed protein product [Oppiella nova]CAG2181426.1 unnamed protein product [Oppiella nova]
MKSQFKRGGGGMCISSDKVWHIFMKSIEQIEGCQKSTTTSKSGHSHHSHKHSDGESAQTGCRCPEHHFASHSRLLCTTFMALSSVSLSLATIESTTEHTADEP